MLPAPASAEIVAARFAEPTDRYGHNVLGTAGDHAALVLTDDGGRRIRFRLPDDQVFEDIAPRLADTDGDAAREVVVVASGLSDGARLTVWDMGGMVAATLPIGRRNRWLAPVGVADLDGDGRIEIAYVETPHLGRVLRILRRAGGRLVPVAALNGVTNHRIGDAFIQGGIADCPDGPVILTASADWSRIVAVTFDGRGLTPRDAGPYAGPDSLDPARFACPG